MTDKPKPKQCHIHQDKCPGDSGHMFIDMNHPDEMYPHIQSATDKDREFWRTTTGREDR